MKILGLTGYFFLPDDFDGGFSAALRAMADYHDSKQAAELRVVSEPRPAESNKHRDYWNEAWASLRDSGRRIFFSTSFSELRGGKHVMLDLETGRPL